MHWHIIRWLRDNTRATWYDLGGTDGFQGLHQFKKGMVGDAGVITPVPPVANYAAYRLPFLIGSTRVSPLRDLGQQRPSLDREQARRSSQAATSRVMRTTGGGVTDGPRPAPPVASRR